MPPFTKEQLELHHKLLKSQLQISKPDTPTPTCSFSQAGNVPSIYLSTDSTGISSWIIDSWASDHMIWNFHFFSMYIPSAGNKKVKVVDGSFSAVAGKGTDKVSGRTIGNARESEGLYFLEDGDNSINLSSACLNSVLVDNKFMLWHYRLGHPSFH
ncbi:hypothetical protein KY289_010797 [Solanum tuberosum]|nr:hypothetical protein KY289_010797 [Solanum tuberosum]